MPLQYISDNAGNHTAVVTPISEWELLTGKHEDLKELEQPKQNFPDKKPSDFAGTLPADIAEDFSKYAANDVTVSTETNQPKLKPSQMRGFLSAATAEAMQLHTQQSRNEWDTF